MKEFNLSEKIVQARVLMNFNGGQDGVIVIDKIKEFIRLLKEKFKSNITIISKREFLTEIDKLAGDKLI